MDRNRLRRLGFWKSFLIAAPFFVAGNAAWGFFETGVRGPVLATIIPALIGGTLQAFFFVVLERVYLRTHE